MFECQPCITPLCKICTASTCTSCLSGYFLIDGECVSCPFSNCKLCDPSLAFCLICDDNYFYDNLGCKSCLDINCSKCNSKGECTACPVNTILVGLSCIACPISHCFTCATVNVCLNCVEGYHWSTGNSACEKLTEETPWWFWTVVGVAGVGKQTIIQ